MSTVKLSTILKGVVEEVTLEKLVDVINSGDKEAINEASLSRVYQHYKREASDSFAILTAFRAEYPMKKNIQKNKELEKRIRSMGLGFFKIKGHWLECQDPSLEYSDCPDEMKVPVVEYSFFIPNITRKQAVKIASDYFQDAFIYSGPETNDKVVSLSDTDKVISTLGDFSPNRIAQGYSKLRGKSFTFEGFQYIPQGMMEGMVFSKNNSK